MSYADIRPELDQRDNGRTYRLDPRVLHTHQSFPSRPARRQITVMDVCDRIVVGMIVVIILASSVGGLMFFMRAVSAIVAHLLRGH